MDKDYYKIMGLTQDASEKDIKTAYRKLARKYHPDISKEAKAEERFKEMGEAYEVLKDPEKRAQYDQYRQQQAFHQKNPQANKEYFYQGTSPFQEGSFDGDWFESLFAHAASQKTARSGQHYESKIKISLEEAFHGSIKNLQIPQALKEKPSLQTLKVKIPAGVKSGQRIRLTGQGAPGIHGGPPGDLYLTVEITKHPLFDVLNNDLYLTLPIVPWEAALGATVKVPTLAGKIDLKIPPSSQGGQKLRIKHRGLPGTPPGDQYVLLKIITPPATTEAAKNLYQQMAQVMPFNPRENLGAFL